MFSIKASQILLAISSMIGVKSLYTDTSGLDWSKAQWIETKSGYMQFQSESVKAAEFCKNNPSKTIELPQVIHGAHKIQAGDYHHTWGDLSFKEKAASFFEAPVLDCGVIPKDAKSILWTVVSYTKYFARIHNYPSKGSGSYKNYFFTNTINVAATGILLTLSFLFLILYYHKTHHKILISIIVACWGLALYAMFSVSTQFNVHVPMLTAHRFADISLWVGVLGLVFSLYYQEMFTKYDLSTVFFASTLGIVIIIFSQNGDQTQLGTTVGFPVVVIIFLKSLMKEANKIFKNPSIVGGLKLLLIFIFISGAYHDIFLVMGVIDSGYPLFGLAALAGLLISAILVNNNITQAYKERDDLLVSLEERVHQRTNDLNRSLIKLKEAQSVLIVQEKLASLGSMTAGIAHEIKNPMYVITNATESIGDLLSEVFSTKGKPDKNIYQQLSQDIKALTAVLEVNCSKVNNIINNMLSLTRGESQQKTKHRLSEVFKESTKFCYTTFKGRYLFDCELVEEIDDLGEYSLYKDDFSRVLINIIDNAFYAVKLKKESDLSEHYRPRIKLILFLQDGEAVLQIEDNGVGIPKEMLNKIFDPFFTSKPTGDGTGLGLSLANDVIKRHGGEIGVESQQGLYTRFTIRLPSM